MGASPVMSGLRVAPTTEPITRGEWPPSRTTDVLIVGAGPYGISLSYELHRRGIPFEVVGHPFSLWRRHRESPVSSGVSGPAAESIGHAQLAGARNRANNGSSVIDRGRRSIGRRNPRSPGE